MQGIEHADSRSDAGDLPAPGIDTVAPPHGRGQDDSGGEVGAEDDRPRLMGDEGPAVLHNNADEDVLEGVATGLWAHGICGVRGKALDDRPGVEGRLAVDFGVGDVPQAGVPLQGVSKTSTQRVLGIWSGIGSALNAKTHPVVQLVPHPVKIAF
ncbi:hypothetical protein B0H17DRAFT_1140708 [Mycena rosella]|uniref:Uncharacterized protein n=1 Tax=Mycena rosella TaxID=1033263 RepID=A0AAD7D168_MYCRO|nr:hypothetical protein B0H17DRAFT_1140708 [Mycena rosella]